jgi:hypothetical protein
LKFQSDGFGCDSVEDGVAERRDDSWRDHKNKAKAAINQKIAAAFTFWGTEMGAEVCCGG